MYIFVRELLHNSRPLIVFVLISTVHLCYAMFFSFPCLVLQVVSDLSSRLHELRLFAAEKGDKKRSSSTGIFVACLYKTILKKVNHKPPSSLGCVKVLLWFISVKLLEIAKCSPSPRPELISRAWAQVCLQQLLSIDGCQWQLASGFSSTPLELTSQRNLNFKPYLSTVEGSA